jgi:putative acetyltransferase
MHANITEAGHADLEPTLRVERAAFARDEEAELVAALLQDPTAQPLMSLLAFAADRPVGHVLFTAVAVDGAVTPVPASILAPLAVVPDVQRQGVGRTLIEEGARRLAAKGVRLLFVLGDPAYYARFGFVPAMPFGLLPPYPIVPQEAWMVRPLAPNVLGTVSGPVSCARSMARPEYWRE